jgi:hypothetical protein
MAEEDEEPSEPLPPLDGTSFAVLVGVGLATLVALIAVAALVVSAHDELLRVVS